ncbi:hypothetical protein IAR55_003391 [Kwoniella newhampshirensis]|uniref:Response regulatory domain-containing protein n=1 Tax=Kwoniella newhampshirensis TaxID=1651941 RepID=A0AAW0YZ79_9TREE
MSRIPSGPPPSHFAHQQSQLPAPPSSQPPSFYPNHLPLGLHPSSLPAHGGPPPSQSYPPTGAGTAGGADPSLYAYERHPHSMSGNGGAWSGLGPPGQGHGPEGYHNAVAGPSRGAGGGDPYQAYAQPPRSSPSHHRQPVAAAPAVGWSSMHPGAPVGRGGVKLEDLVSNERRNVVPGPAPGSAGTQAQLPPLQTQAQMSAPVASLSQPNGKTTLSSLPLSATHSFDHQNKAPSTAGDGSGGAGTAGGAGTGGNQQQGPSDFIKKLYKMLEEESAQFGKGVPPGKRRGEGAKRGSVGWGQGGASFVVWDMNDFTTKVLPQTFRHSNFSSFVRQLNKYGFSKIKHVDEQTGTIKENVWEFQHPSFQAGGKADLENIKRKPVGPKKGAGADTEDTSPKGPGLSGEDMSRMNVMEHRIVRLEEDLMLAMREVQDARTRESGMMGLMRDMIGHLVSNEQDANGSTNNASTARVLQLRKTFDEVSQGIPMSRPNTASVRSGVSFATPIQSNFGQGYNSGGNFAPGFSNGSTLAQTSPRTDGTGSRGSISVNSPSDIKPTGMRNVSGPSSGLASSTSAPQDQTDDIIELPTQMQTLYDGEPMGVTPIFADTPAWLTEGTTVPLPIYHRKSSDGVALRLMYEAIGGGTAARLGDDVPATQPMDGVQVTDQSQGTGPAVHEVPRDLNSMPALQHASFGIVIPQDPSDPSLKKAGPPRPKKVPTASEQEKEKESKLVPHWAQKPKILIVEDDVVYRQLSRKFLQKFGCETESVENAQGAVDKMNRTKYDLVLMDIFFGPNMDGRKATSLIRQFDNYTPIISMTSNAQPQDVDSYFQSGMNDILAKPFTKHHLFCILDKHLIHLRHAQLYEKLIPVGVGLPPLSDQHVEEALAVTAANIQGTGGDSAAGGELEGFRNPLAGTGWSDDTYQLVLQQFLATGTMPDVSTISNGAIGTSVVFGDSSHFNSNGKRSIETINDDEWDASSGSVQAGGDGSQGLGVGAGVAVPMAGSMLGGAEEGREMKRARGLVG